MRLNRRFVLGLALALLGLPAGLLAPAAPARGCALCTPGMGGNTLTLREEAAQAKLVLYGQIENPKLAANTCDLRIATVVKSDPFVRNKNVVALSRYLPVPNPSDPPKFLVFCDVYNGKLDAYRGVPVKSVDVVDYIKGAAALDPKDRPKALLYYFRYLDSTDAFIAEDAYLEFAKASDREVGLVSKQLSPQKLRSIIENPSTPPARVGLYAFLLGACGGDREAELLRSMIGAGNARAADALDGLLSGYIQLRPRDGWAQARAILADPNRPFTDRFAVLRMCRFYHGWKGDEVRAELRRAAGAAVDQGDIADLAIGDLMSWKLWDLTPQVLGQFDKKTHAAPLVRRTIVRYALVCPDADSRRFIAGLRTREPDLVKEIEDALQFEKK